MNRTESSVLLPPSLTSACSLRACRVRAPPTSLAPSSGLARLHANTHERTLNRQRCHGADLARPKVSSADRLSGLQSQRWRPGAGCTRRMRPGRSSQHRLLPDNPLKSNFLARFGTVSAVWHAGTTRAPALPALPSHEPHARTIVDTRALARLSELALTLTPKPSTRAHKDKQKLCAQ